MTLPSCTCGSQTPGLHDAGCARQSSLFGDLSVAATPMLFQNLTALRFQRQTDPDRTVQVSLQLMIDDTIAELERRNQHVLAQRAARRAAS